MKTTNGRILVVDDDQLNRIKISTNLEDAGYEVVLANNGREGLEMMQAESFDTVLLDLMMPLMDGFEVLEQVQSDASLQQLPIIVISAEDDLDSIVRCIELGAADHLPKQFNPAILRARIRACVKAKRSHDRENALFEALQHNYQQLQELQQLRDDLTHMIVHDLRTPLTSLLTGLQSIPLVGELTPDQDECLQVATQGGEGLLAMINELLDICKMEDGSLQLEREPVDIAHLWQRALGQIKPLAQDKGISIHREIAPELSNIQVDEDKMVRVLVNLCSNAVKFTPRGGTITVGAKWAENLPDSPELLMWVADTGEGIPPDQFERIFEKFGQVESRKSGRKMSTGLGLTFCKMTVEKHGGRIWVESERGHGSQFSLSIPTDT